MSTEHAPSNATEYIQHHLSFNAYPVGDGMVHVDSVITAFVIGALALGFIWWVARGATAGVPGKRQAFVELLFEFIDDTVKGIFTHGDRHRFIAPAALTVFVWVLVMNALDFIPADAAAKLTGLFSDEWRLVPTADVNTTFALALAVWFLMIFYGIKVKGIGGWIHEIFCAPFGRPSPAVAGQLPAQCRRIRVQAAVACRLRLYGNMYAGELIFLLLWVWAATGLARDHLRRSSSAPVRPSSTS
jgi:F-type H+-transporting ATPase subunit a